MKLEMPEITGYPFKMSNLAGFDTNFTNWRELRWQAELRLR